MDLSNIPLTISSGAFATIMVVAFVPAILWAVSIHRQMKELLQLHHDPDPAATAQHELVKELYESTAELHAKNTQVISQNTNAIHQLTHYIRWFSRQQGKELPPALPGEP